MLPATTPNSQSSNSQSPNSPAPKIATRKPSRGPSRFLRRRTLAAALAATSLLALAHLAVYRTTQPTGETSPFSGPAVTIQVLADPELTSSTQWEDLLKQAKSRTNVTVRFQDPSSQPETPQSGPSAAAIWYESDATATLNRPKAAKAGSADQLATSPLVIGLPETAVQNLGWDRNSLTWADITEALAGHRLSLAMSDPRQAASGLGVLAAVASSVNASTGTPEPQRVATAVHRIRALATDRIEPYDQAAMATQQYLNWQRSTPAAQRTALPAAIISDEASILRLNDSGQLDQPLSLIYPADGTPELTLTASDLNTANAKDSAAHQRLVAWLRSPEGQQRLMRQLRLRPASPDNLQLAGFPGNAQTQVTTPTSQQTTEELLAAYQGTSCQPSRTAYLLDLSGSMDDQRATADRRATTLSQIMRTLTAPDGACPDPGQAEELTVLPFRSTPQPPTTVQLAGPDDQSQRAELQQQLSQLFFYGNTAIYDALIAAYRTVEQQSTQQPARITSLVLISDGENTTGHDASAFAQFHAGLPAELAAVPVFVIQVGKPHRAPLRQIADLTGGQLFDARSTQLRLAAAAIHGHAVLVD